MASSLLSPDCSCGVGAACVESDGADSDGVESDGVESDGDEPGWSVSSDGEPGCADAGAPELSVEVLAR